MKKVKMLKNLMFFVKILTKLHISAIIIKKTERQRENMNSDLYWIWFDIFDWIMGKSGT